uniref:Zinc finger, SWIM-type containing 2 n=1 Tax=Labrus bergylta TaxID=56723 RepID=A0A3Q3ERK2_9LABR|nr:E3 ubiquitin-protein ligase ZSWIM2 [Labrus bergylta]
MFRKITWRNTVSNAVSFHQDQALNTTIFLLKSFGPTGFLLREEGEAKNFKVCLGNPHNCTCPVFTREQEPCKHICWVLLRKFRLPREHEYSFQPGLVERQILEVLHGLHQAKAHRMENDPFAASGTLSQPATGGDAGSVCRKVIEGQDVCPICQEELLEKKQPVCYCRFGCGNNIHISCMKVWADHQRLSDEEETVKCPLCREDFSSLKLLQEQVRNTAQLFTAAEREKPERHLGVLCNSCLVCPVIGKCFKCTVCSYFYLCEDCIKKGCHQQHLFTSRAKRKEMWHLVEDLSDEPTGASCPSLNDSVIPVAADLLPENILACLPTVKVRPRSRLLDVGLQCRICLQDFNLGQHVRTLPCHHKFHIDCVDRILLKTNCCPLDGFVIYNPLTWRSSERKTPAKLASCLYSEHAKPAENNLKDLFVPGVALRNSNTKVSPTHGSLNLAVRLLTLNTTTQKESIDRKSDLQRKQTPENSPFSVGKCDSKSSSKTKHTLVSPNQCPAVTNIRDQPGPNLFVGLCRPELDLTAAVGSPARRTRLQPKRTSAANIKDTNRLMSELRMTGVLIKTQQQ